MWHNLGTQKGKQLANLAVSVLLPHQDAIGGIIIALLLMAIVIPGLNAIDYLIFHSPYTPAVIIATTIILLYIYPVEPDR